MTAFESGTSLTAASGGNSSTTAAATAAEVLRIGGGDGTIMSAGLIVELQTVTHAVIRGQVLSYDPANKILVLKDTSSGKPIMRLVNMRLVGNFDVIKEKTDDYVPYVVKSDTTKAEDRLKKTVEKRKSSMLKTKISPQGQRAFIYLRKTLDDVEWNGEDIVVMKVAVVKPPYTPDSIQPMKLDEKTQETVQRGTIDQTRKMLQRWMEENGQGAR